MEKDSVSLSDIPTLLVIRGVAMMLLAVGLVGGLHAYLAHRLASGPAQLLFALLFISIPVGFAAGRRGPSTWTKVALWVSHLWIGVFGVLLTVVLALDLGRVVFGAVSAPTAWSGRFTIAALTIGAAISVWGVWVARGRSKVTRQTLPVKDLGEGLRGLRIVQISDIHIGQTLDGRFLRRIVDQVNALRPDIVAVTGDLVDGFVHSTRDEVAPLRDLRGTLGVFYVTGNHEYYYGGPAWEAEVRRLGLTVLRNEHRVLERDGARVVIAGVTDYDGGHFGDDHACRPDLALRGAPQDVPRVLLAHQPRTARKVNGARVDLQLSGHTHGGQIFPFNFLVLLQQPVISGLRTVHGVRVYTHNGTGYWGPPMRVGPAPEIAVLELVPAT